MKFGRTKDARLLSQGTLSDEVSVSVVLCIALVAWGLVIPSAVVCLRLRRAAAADRRPAPMAPPPRACERRLRPAAARRAVTRAH
jgi:hypothetical protein